MRHAALTVACLSLIGFTCGAEPVRYVFHHRACSRDVNPPLPPAIAVGCEYPGIGCQANSRITSVAAVFDAPAGSTATLTISNVQQAHLTVNGRGSGPNIVLGPGASTISGFPDVAVGSPVPLISASVEVPLTPVRQGEQGAASTDTKTVKLLLTQLVDALAVRETELDHLYHPCTVVLQTGDRIEQTSFLSAKDAVALIDGRRASGCVSMESHPGPAVIALGNLLRKNDPVTNLDCAARAAIFSDSNAVAYRPDVNWTDSTDVIQVASKPMVIEKVKSWLLYDPCVIAPSVCTPSVAAGVKLWAQTELAIASTAYQQQFAGIGFDQLGTTIDLTGAGAATETVQHAWAPPGCSTAEFTGQTLALLHAITGDTPPDQLNVFYVQGLPFGTFGEWCGVHDSGQGANTIIMSSTHYPHTLAHEIGHALLNSANHAVAGTDGFTSVTSSQNLMGVGSLGEFLTIGQLFRANLDSGSAVNRHHARNGATTSCDSPMQGNFCPPLAFDVRPR